MVAGRSAASSLLLASGGVQGVHVAVDIADVDGAADTARLEFMEPPVSWTSRGGRGGVQRAGQGGLITSGRSGVHGSPGPVPPVLNTAAVLLAGVKDDVGLARSDLFLTTGIRTEKAGRCAGITST